jgi:hypothetical protein
MAGVAPLTHRRATRETTSEANGIVQRKNSSHSAASAEFAQTCCQLVYGDLGVFHLGDTSLS